MPLLHLALQEGFADDTVVVRFNDDEVLHQSGVSTRWQISLAESVERDVPPGPVDIQIRVPSRNTSDSLRVNVSQPIYVAVSITDAGEIAHRISTEPFGYV